MSLWDILPEDLQLKIIEEKENKHIKYDFFRHMQKKIFNIKYKELLYDMLNDENDEYNDKYVGRNIHIHDDFQNDILNNNRYIINLDDDLITPFRRDIYLYRKRDINLIINKYPAIIIKDLFPAYYNIDFQELQSIQLIRRFLHRITFYE
jgi:hypothetical protein